MVVVSSEVEELMLLCDRIAVMSAGRLVRVFERGEWTEERLLAAAFEGNSGPGPGRRNGSMTGPTSSPSPSLPSSPGRPASSPAAPA